MIHYKCEIEEGIKYGLNTFSTLVFGILNHPKSWGIRFIESENQDITIILSKGNTVKEICNLTGLSCANARDSIIYININRWLKGSKRSGLNLDDYRTYLILHEMGHILGLSHLPVIKCKKVPVMNQSTLGLKGGLPNQYPLKYEKELLRQIK